MIYRSESQNKLLHALLNATQLTDMKEELVLSYTGGRTEHSSEMSYTECEQLINALQQDTNKMRRKILSICHQLGWYVRKNEVLQLSNGRPILDMQRINDWCIKYSAQHKPLNDHSKKELRTLVTQFQRVLSHHLKTITIDQNEKKSTGGNSAQ